MAGTFHFMKAILNLLKSYVLPLIVPLAFLLLYFYPQLQGRVLKQYDITSFQATAHEALRYQKETGEVALWTNSAYGGMPTYQVGAPQKSNLFKHLQKLIRLGFSGPIGLMLPAIFSMYVLLIVSRVDPWLAAVTASVFAFATNHLILIEAGHTSKIASISYMPLVLAGLQLVLDKKYALGGVLSLSAMALILQANHFQMPYYFLLLLIPYLLWQVVNIIQKREWKHLLLSASVLLVGLLIALGSSASKILTTIDYTPETIRGRTVLESEHNSNSGKEDGLSWKEAMQWSNAPIDLFALIIPRAAGGSDYEQIAGDPTTSKLYWGGLPSTSGPPYLGIIICLLAIMSIWVLKGYLKWVILAAVTISIILSMGQNMGWINHLLFEYFPLYDKFRAPASILSITPVFTFWLAAMTMQKISEFDSAQNQEKALKRGTGILLAISALVLILAQIGFDFGHFFDYEIINNGGDLELLKEKRKSALIVDTSRMLLLVLLFFFVLMLYQKNKISRKFLIGSFCLLAMADLWMIGKRYLISEDFVENVRQEQQFEPRDVDLEIQRDTNLFFRVHDLTNPDPFNIAQPSYFHSMIGGYHAAVLRRYKDVIDTFLRKEDPHLLNMLNTRYLIRKGKEGRDLLELNAGAAGNAWLVDSISYVNSNREELIALKGGHSLKTAIVHKDFSNMIGDLEPTGLGTIKLTSYSPNELVYQFNSENTQVAIFSDLWYGPDKGWEAYIDDESVQIARANYILRTLKIPSGNHEIRFVFKPRAYFLGEQISMISSLIAMLLILALVIFRLKDSKDL